MASLELQVEDLSVHLGSKRVLSNLYFNVTDSMLVGILGPNGAGKSTLLKAILGLIDSATGAVTINGQSIDQFRSRIAYIPQKDQVDWTFPATVFDVVYMGRFPHKRIWQRMNSIDKELVNEAMSQMNIEHLQDRQIGELSGGQQQRVFLARALCQKADLFFLDEPFVGVDIITEQKTIETLQLLAQQGKIIMVVHHDLSTVSSYFDQVMLINHRLVSYGDVEDAFTSESIGATFGGQPTILQKAGLLR